MLKGLITSLLIKLTFEFWYLTLIAMLVKVFLIRYTVTDSKIKVFLIWLTGTIVFYCISCLAGIVFSSAGFYYIPFIMFAIAVFCEILFLKILFRFSTGRLSPSVIIADALFFFLLFMQMM